MTPLQLSLLIRRHQLAAERQQSYFALIAAITANFSWCRPKDQYRIEDFMPRRNRKAETPEQIARRIRDKLFPVAKPVEQ